MSKIGVLCIDGVEEVECMTVVDFCRRAEIETVTISVTGKTQIMGSHQIPFITDTILTDIYFFDFDGIVLPGGPGTAALGGTPGVKELVQKFYDKGKMVAAICAAPSILAEVGILQGKKATAYPGCKPEGKALWTENAVEVDQNVITGKGPGVSNQFALEIIRYLRGETVMSEVKKSTMMD